MMAISKILRRTQNKAVAKYILETGVLLPPRSPPFFTSSPCLLFELCFVPNMGSGLYWSNYQLISKKFQLRDDAKKWRAATFSSNLWLLKMKQRVHNAYLGKTEHIICNKSEQGPLSY